MTYEEVMDRSSHGPV